jgi:hypothetical protein
MSGIFDGQVVLSAVRVVHCLHALVAHMIVMS